MTAVSERPIPTDTHAEDNHRRADKAEVRDLLEELSNPRVGRDRQCVVREELVSLHVGLAEHLARRFRNRGEPLDDLIQVALVGLLKAIDGFDPDRGVDFCSYAIPTMVGEIKRHFRDKGWSVRVPRRLKEMKLEVTKASGTLTQDLGRTLTNADLADHLGVSEEQIRECQVSARSYSAQSLSAPLGEDGDSTLADVIGEADKGMATVEDRESLRPLIEELPSRERHIIAMRFYGNMTQSQIAERIGISQMHVSRLLTRSLAQLRAGMLIDA
ncbi:MAG: RNA polymerase sigma factor SigF [Geodermatophilaceae bacterium]|nr:RNA polymerase sigma factor SigF [Geodermatophilaceae bacterium]